MRWRLHSSAIPAENLHRCLSRFLCFSGFTVVGYAVVPCQPLFILGLIFGIWSLIVLNRPHIKAAFARAANT